MCYVDTALNDIDIIILKNINSDRHIDMLIYDILGNIRIYKILIYLIEQEHMKYILKSRGFLSIDIERGKNVERLINLIKYVNNNRCLSYIFIYSYTT